ncbi:MAG: hypothetical protein ABI742_01320 [Gemmatimonadota bacterium]
MGLPALILAQALISLAPTIENVRTMPANSEFRVPSSEFEVLETPNPELVTLLSLSDSVRRHKAITLSDGYYARLNIHRYAGYATLPLMAVAYLSGRQELAKGSAAPLWADKSHKPAAYLLAGVFALNTVTGLVNLAEASKVKQGKTRRWVHSIMMLAADAAMVYGIAKAPSLSAVDARLAAGKHGGWTPHKAGTITSMSLATVGYLMMFVWKE